MKVVESITDYNKCPILYRRYIDVKNEVLF